MKRGESKTFKTLAELEVFSTKNNKPSAKEYKVETTMEDSKQVLKVTKL